MVDKRKPLENSENPRHIVFIDDDGNLDLEGEVCWFCEMYFDVAEDDYRFVQIYFQDEDEREIKTIYVPLCTTCGSRLISADYPGDTGPSVVFRAIIEERDCDCEQ